MAVETNILVYSAKEITAQDFAVLMEHVTPQTSGVLYGCNVTISNSSTIHISSGWCIIRGRLIRIEEGDVSLTIPSSGSSTQYVIIEVNLSNDALPCHLFISSTVPSDTTDFNVAYGQAYLKLASFTLGTSGASNISNYDVMASSDAVVSRDGWSNYQWYHTYSVNAPNTARGAGSWTDFTSSNILVPKSKLNGGMYLVNYVVTLTGSSNTLGMATIRFWNGSKEIPSASKRSRQSVPVCAGLYSTANASFIWNTSGETSFMGWPQVYASQGWYPKEAFIGLTKIGNEWTNS